MTADEVRKDLLRQQRRYELIAQATDFVVVRDVCERRLAEIRRKLAELEGKAES